MFDGYKSIVKKQGQDSLVHIKDKRPGYLTHFNQCFQCLDDNTDCTVLAACPPRPKICHQN